jgi:hypothetical protein
MEWLILLGLVSVAWTSRTAYMAGKRCGSRKGFAAGARRRRKYRR